MIIRKCRPWAMLDWHPGHTICSARRREGTKHKRHKREPQKHKKLNAGATFLCLLGSLLCLLCFVPVPVEPSPQVRVGANDIGGVVSGAKGPEAGVWVIAETSDLPTLFSKVVVTDDLGRYLIPDLPKANYRIWVRGYGLIDSPKTQTAPGRIANLTATAAPTAAAAAEYYPPIY